MVEYIGLQAVGWHVMVETWWDKVLASILLSTAVVGSISVLFRVYRKVTKYWHKRRQLLVAPTTISAARFLDDLKTQTQQLCLKKHRSKEPKSFGSFLGSIATPPTPNQARILSQWDIIVLDPFQAGVLEAAVSQCISTHVVGQLDVGMIVKSESSSGSAEVFQSLSIVAQTLIRSFKRPQDTYSTFTGVLLTNWQQHFSTAICNELIKFMDALGLDVYLEIIPPTFLTESQCRDISMECIKGIICQNGTILPDGERRNFFQMADVRPALKALAKYSSMRDTYVMMLEIIDDNVTLQHSVVKRSFIWCGFNSAITWIGPKSALTDAEIAVSQTVVGEPLGALMWLKDDEVMKAHNLWRLNDKICERPSADDAIYDSLESFVPNLASKLSLSPPSIENGTKSQSFVMDAVDWLTCTGRSQTNPLSVSPVGNDYTGLGCFQLGLDCSWKDFTWVVETQRRLKTLGLLKIVTSKDLRRVSVQLKALLDTHSCWTNTLDESRAVEEFIDLIAASNGDERDRLRVHVGLDSGFRNGLDTQFRGVYDIDGSTGVIDVYISGKTNDLASTILHTLMSSKKFTRMQCFVAEMALSEQTGVLNEIWRLPWRFVQDIEQLSPKETILLVQRLALSNCDRDSLLLARVRSCCEYQLMEVVTTAQLRALNAKEYLGDQVSAEDLINSRLAWYREQDCKLPNAIAAVSLFKEIDARVSNVLANQETQLLSLLLVVLRTVLQKDQIDASADLFALSVICAFRRLALNEVYLEILDRNPLPNAHPDQAACFAEMFALGSRCENYFDMTPGEAGTILSKRYHAYYKTHQPPPRDDYSTELPTAYASKQIDLDPDAASEEPPMYYQITFLGIFALPALVDILMLTTIGRGLYVTAYMSETEKTMATTALMISLLLTGAIGTWISSGGSYYLHSMAFSAMNMFVLTRMVAGIAVCLSGGLIAFILISVYKGFYAGIIFFLYLCLLTTYLSMLATLAIYQIPGFMFQSGRLVIMTCVPILLISPIVTLWVHYDIQIYLSVITCFLISLLLGARKIISQWSTWYLKVPCVTDNEVVNWYTQMLASNSDASSGLPDVADLAATPLPRKALVSSVLRERSRRPWARSTADELVSKLAEGYSATMFLMDWYCKYSRTKMPYPYSPTWNLQCKAAVDTLRDMQKGLKLHNAFVHWRDAGDEVWCGVLYFVIALLDKWVVLISGGSLLGLSAAGSQTFRLAVGFGLAYYLIGALFLDGAAQPLWALANKVIPQPITSLNFLQEAAIIDARAKRKLYWTSLIKFLFMHIWGLSITASLMWSFDKSKDAMIMYVAYIGAYTGLLWYQYNRIFTGPLALKDLVVAAVLGLLTGPLMHHFMPLFAFNSVSALAVGTWTAAILSLRTSKIGIPGIKFDKHVEGSTKQPVYRFSGAFGVQTLLSQTTLAEAFDSICTLAAEYRYRLDPLDHPGAEVMSILMSRNSPHKSMLVQAAFPSAEQLVHEIIKLWKYGNTVIDLVPAGSLIQREHNIKTISRVTEDRLHIFVFVSLGLVGDAWITDIRRNCKIIAEAIIQASAEAKLGLSYDHSTLAETLISSNSDEEELSLPEGIKRQLETSAIERERLKIISDKALLHYLLLGLDCDTDWDSVPRSIRGFLLKRSCGEPYHISNDQLTWIQSRLSGDPSLEIDEYIARNNLGATLASLVNSLALMHDTDDTSHLELRVSSYESSIDFTSFTSRNIDSDNTIELFKALLYRIHHAAKVCIKFFVVSLVADTEYQRELDYWISGKSGLIRWPVTFFLNGIWMFCKNLQKIILPYFLFHGRENVSKLYRDMKGVKTTIKKRKIVIESLSSPSTGFFVVQADGSFKLHQYSGYHDQQPTGLQDLMAINTYTEKLILSQREEYTWGALVNQFTYEYPLDDPNRRYSNIRTRRTMGSKLPVKLSRRQNPLPMERRCSAGNLIGQVVHYDRRGYITSGSVIKDENLIEFKYWYRKNAKFDDELLRAEYILPHISVTAVWSVPPPNQPEKRDEWIPHSKVIEATFVEGPKIYRSKWVYDHKFHPIISTTLNGSEVTTPPMIQHDWLKVLQKPKDFSFENDNPLFPFQSVSTSFISRMLGRNVQWYPISTSRARTHLWKLWKNGKEFDAVTTRWLDEVSLRADPVLRTYWRNRNFGRLEAAEKYLDAQVDNVMARVDIDPEISSWTPLAFKISDLYSFGQGGDARINTRTQSTQLQDSDSELHILAMDTGTWPNEGGGVSACRRDMVNNLSTIRWHILAESANDFGVPKFQIEKNVQSLTVLPLWGLDFLTPTHGIFEDSLDSEVQQRSHNTTEKDILRRFAPILKILVRCSRAISLNHQHIEEASKALVDLNSYFESSRHWSEVWKSDVIKKVWRQLWLAEDVDNAMPLSEWLDAERPTLLHLDQALDMWHRYLFIFSIPVPERIPDVFQASHHFAGASYGVLCKLKRQCTLHVWDHCISWREVTVFLSSAMSFDPPFVCTALMSLSRLASVLILHHADVVLPCADFFNPGWEIELGTQQGTLQHRRTFARRIDPVVNGITGMENFKPIETIRSKLPTVTMLSHVRFVKDIKTAILAADIIVNDWGFNDYRLEIWGDMEKAPTYSVECQEILASKSLGANVALKGLGSPSKVLEDAWLFLNSSVSEGLPLAMGEAALTGVPVVCTDVGASFRVVTDPITSKRFSAVVAPNDALSLARAQINVLGLLDEWSEYAEDGDRNGERPKLSAHPTKEEVEWITKRMYEKTEQRRRLGMMGRTNVLESFSSERYLREHEQMLWIGKYQSPSYRLRTGGLLSRESSLLLKES